MAHQRDPDDPRRDDDTRLARAGTWPVAAFIGALAVVAILGFLMYSSSGERSSEPVTPRSPGATAPTTAPSATPPPGALKQGQ
jgi:hypothetical protein